AWTTSPTFLRLRSRALCPEGAYVSCAGLPAEDLTGIWIPSRDAQFFALLIKRDLGKIKHAGGQYDLAVDDYVILTVVRHGSRALFDAQGVPGMTLLIHASYLCPRGGKSVPTSRSPTSRGYPAHGSSASRAVTPRCQVRRGRGPAAAGT